MNLNSPNVGAHNFLDLRSATAGSGMCSTHRRICSCSPVPGMIDVLVAGFPCQAYSLQRAKRWCDGGVKDHPQAWLAAAVIGFTRVWQPSAAIFENVVGFQRKSSQTDETVPLEVFLEDLRGCGNYAAEAVTMDLSLWSEAKRPRPCRFPCPSLSPR